MPHKYRIGQVVRLTRPALSDRHVNSASSYEVTRLMPADQTGEVSYRIQSAGANQRAVRESEITAGLSGS